MNGHHVLQLADPARDQDAVNFSSMKRFVFNSSISSGQKKTRLII